MKRHAAKSVSLLLVFATMLLMVHMWGFNASASADRTVIEVSSWDELSEAFAASKWDGATWKIMLMADLTADARDVPRSQTAVRTYELCGCSLVFDFNGHKLSCTDRVSGTDLAYSLSDFIRINVYLSERRTLTGFERYGSTVTFTDSVGGGGVYMDSSRAKDNAIAALHVVSYSRFYAMGGYYTDSKVKNNLVIDSGSYVLDCKAERFGNGTLNIENAYRGTVIADNCITEINGGYFKANGIGHKSGDDDMCARELAAFGTCCSTEETQFGIFSGETVINGGVFVSNGYSVHHFDLATKVNETRSMFFPYINGGIFSGPLGFVGMTFRYSDGNSELCAKPASTVLCANNTIVVGIIGSNRVFKGVDGIKLGDLHNCRSLIVIGDKAAGFVRASEDGSPVALTRCSEDTEEFCVEYSLAGWLTEYVAGIEVTPYVTVVSGDEATRVSQDEVSIDYSDHPGGVTVHTCLELAFSGCSALFENVYEISVSVVKEAPVIIKDPVSVTVEPGSEAVLTVTADHAAAYKWYFIIDGRSFPVEILADENISGYNTSALKVTTNSVTSAVFYCAVTGSDGTVMNTKRATVYFGRAPKVVAFSGGKYHEGGSALFNLRAEYLDRVSWFVYDKKAVSNDLKIRALDDFIASTNVECSVKQNNTFGYASLEFRNVPSGFDGRYLVGYMLNNELGEVAFSLDSCIPFTLVKVYPEITLSPCDAVCGMGGEAFFRAQAKGAARFEWLFEIPDDSGEWIVKTVEEIRLLYPHIAVTVSSESASATELTIENAVSELNGIRVYCRAEGAEASSFTAPATLYVRENDYIVGDFNKDGNVDSADAIYLLRCVLFPVDYPIEQPGDLTADGDLNSADAIYLLRHVLFPDDFPLE